jgi:hypothetical protein
MATRGTGRTSGNLWRTRDCSIVSVQQWFTNYFLLFKFFKLQFVLAFSGSTSESFGSLDELFLRFVKNLNRKNSDSKHVECSRVLFAEQES